jgi:hypothetical protein
VEYDTPNISAIWLTVVILLALALGTYAVVRTRRRGTHLDGKSRRDTHFPDPPTPIKPVI